MTRNFQYRLNRRNICKLTQENRKQCKQDQKKFLDLNISILAVYLTVLEISMLMINTVVFFLNLWFRFKLIENHINTNVIKF